MSCTHSVSVEKKHVWDHKISGNKTNRFRKKDSIDGKNLSMLGDSGQFVYETFSPKMVEKVTRKEKRKRGKEKTLRVKVANILKLKVKRQRYCDDRLEKVVSMLLDCHSSAPMGPI